jgi:hypothetical protein
MNDAEGSGRVEATRKALREIRDESLALVEEVTRSILFISAYFLFPHLYLRATCN